MPLNSRVTLLGLLLISLPCASAHAREVAEREPAPVAPVVAPEPLPESEPSAEYREAIDLAVGEFAEGHHAEARALFRRAHELSPSARTLRGIGMCSFELRDYAEAARTLSASLSDARRPLTDEQRAQVESALGRALAFVGRFTVSLPDGAAVFVDGAALAAPLEEDGTLLLSLGDHALVARDGARLLGEARVEVRGGEHTRLDLVAVQTAGSSAIAVQAPPPEDTPRPLPSADPAPGIALLTAGGAAVVGGAVLLGLGLADAATVENATSGAPWSSLEAAYDRAPIFQGIGGALVGVGAVGMAVGVVLLTLDESGSSSAQLRLGPASASLRGSF